jgi:hypothetical protein
MRALFAIVAICCFLVVTAVATAAPIAPYDGTNPFRCRIQKVGTGTEVPHPNADPFCVEFDKENQNVTEFGIVEFLLDEPARTAAAVPKCFYYQIDHWTGSIVQGGQPTLWHWDGKYFFDKAKGVGELHDRRGARRSQPAARLPDGILALFRAQRRRRVRHARSGRTKLCRKGGHARKGAESLPAQPPLLDRTAPSVQLRAIQQQ